MGEKDVVVKRNKLYSSKLKMRVLIVLDLCILKLKINIFFKKNLQTPSNEISIVWVKFNTVFQFSCPTLSPSGHFGEQQRFSQG